MEANGTEEKKRGFEREQKYRRSKTSTSAGKKKNPEKKKTAFFSLGRLTLRFGRPPATALVCVVAVF